MRRFRFGRKKARKGIVGIEAAIVLIAFVLVAAALAFVVLNMGMFTAQKSKEVIARAYEESTRAIDVAGSVVANVTNYTDSANAKVTFISIPIKLTAGARAIDLNRTTVSVMVILPDGTSKYYENAVQKPVSSIQKVSGDLSSFVKDTLKLNTSSSVQINATWAYARSTNNNNLLESGEIALLVIKFDEQGISVSAYSRIIVEIKPPEGSVVTVERTVPPMLTSQYVNLDIG